MDSEGFKTEKETTVLETRCYHEQQHDSRRWANLAAFSEATDRFVLRMVHGVTVETGYYLDCHGTRYKILSVENAGERGMYLEIYAQKEVGSLG
jgi:hypothetical protein